MDNFNPEDMQNMTPQDYYAFLQKAFLDTCNNARLSEYKFSVADTVILYLLSKLDSCSTPFNETDQKIMDMYSKVTSANSYETAEAHFMGVTDHFSKEVGFDSFDDLVGKIKIAAQNMKEGDSYDDLVKKMLSEYKQNNENNDSSN
jgi:hypothetical protein